MAGLNGLAQGWVAAAASWAAFLAALPAGQQAAAGKAAAALDAPAQLAADGKRDTGRRIAAVGLLAHRRGQRPGRSSTRLLTDEPVQEVRSAAVRALGGAPRWRCRLLLRELAEA
ncbi:MAG: hypothetical protein U0736_01300 [Gemmataceae bacterium]